jgi:hypothetical protein
MAHLEVRSLSPQFKLYPAAATAACTLRSGGAPRSHQPIPPGLPCPLFGRHLLLSRGKQPQLPVCIGQLCQDAKYQRVLVPMNESRAGSGRPLGSRMDPGIIKLWQDTCSKGHEKCRQPIATTPFPERLWLIDVNQWCVVSISPREKPKYIALSYVWGKLHQPMLSSKTLDEWASPQGLLSITLPATIKDAITVVQSMGIY